MKKINYFNSTMNRHQQAKHCGVNLIDEVHDLCEDETAFLSIDWRLIERACLRQTTADVINMPNKLYTRITDSLNSLK